MSKYQTASDAPSPSAPNKTLALRFAAPVYLNGKPINNADIENMTITAYQHGYVVETDKDAIFVPWYNILYVKVERS